MTGLFESARNNGSFVFLNFAGIQTVSKFYQTRTLAPHSSQQVQLSVRTVQRVESGLAWDPVTDGFTGT